MYLILLLLLFIIYEQKEGFSALFHKFPTTRLNNRIRPKPFYGRTCLLSKHRDLSRVNIDDDKEVIGVYNNSDIRSLLHKKSVWFTITEMNNKYSISINNKYLNSDLSFSDKIELWDIITDDHNRSFIKNNKGLYLAMNCFTAKTYLSSIRNSDTIFYLTIN